MLYLSEPRVVPATRAQPLYVSFHLPCSADSRMGKWGRLPACRREGVGAGGIEQPLDHGVRSPARSACAFVPELEPLPERRRKYASSYPQE